MNWTHDHWWSCTLGNVLFASCSSLHSHCIMLRTSHDTEGRQTQRHLLWDRGSSAHRGDYFHTAWTLDRCHFPPFLLTIAPQLPLVTMAAFEGAPTVNQISGGFFFCFLFFCGADCPPPLPHVSQDATTSAAPLSCSQMWRKAQTKGVQRWSQTSCIVSRSASCETHSDTCDIKCFHRLLWWIHIIDCDVIREKEYVQGLSV